MKMWWVQIRTGPVTSLLHPIMLAAAETLHMRWCSLHAMCCAHLGAPAFRSGLLYGQAAKLSTSLSNR